MAALGRRGLLSPPVWGTPDLLQGKPAKLSGTLGTWSLLLKAPPKSSSNARGEERLTTVRLSSAKVAFTNMAPKTKPRLLSVSLMQYFQRGRQVCRGRWSLAPSSGLWLPS